MDTLESDYEGISEDRTEHIDDLYKDIVKFEEELNKVAILDRKKATRIKGRMNDIRNKYADLFSVEIYGE